MLYFQIAKVYKIKIKKPLSPLTISNRSRTSGALNKTKMLQLQSVTISVCHQPGHRLSDNTDWVQKKKSDRGAGPIQKDGEKLT